MVFAAAGCDGQLTDGAYTGATAFVIGTNSAALAGTQLSLGVRAVDARGATQADFRGTVHFGSSDPNAVLPPDYPFDAGDAGYHLFEDAISFGTPGSQTVTAMALGHGISGSKSGIDVKPPSLAAPSGDANTTATNPNSTATNPNDAAGNPNVANPNMQNRYAPTMCVSAETQPDGSVIGGASITIQPCGNKPEQSWTLQASGAVRLIDAKSGAAMCLDVIDGVNADGTFIEALQCGTRTAPNTPTSAQQWDYDAQHLVLWWHGTDKCLDLRNGQRTAGGQLQIWTCDTGYNNFNQAWVFVR
jgi:hypothetical protein